MAQCSLSILLPTASVGILLRPLQRHSRVLIVLLATSALLAVAAPDWTDCPQPCRCKWTSGKKSALCRDAGFTALPVALDADMQVLDLSGNAITRLSRGIFRNAGLLNLQRVFLRNARVREVHRDAFRDLIILVEVDLSDNDILVLEPDTFHGNERLRILYLSGNPLSELVRAQFPVLPHLRTLDLEGCQLREVHRNAFMHLSALESLNLKANQLANLSETSFMNFAHLKSLMLDSNPWRCDCYLRGLRDWYFASNLRSTSLLCSEPNALTGKLWDDVKSIDFACAPQVILSTQTQVQAEAGGNFSFGCHVLGDPEPVVTWLYEGRPINNSLLVVEAEEGLLDKWVNVSMFNVSDSDAGTYSCLARNNVATVAGNVSLVLPEVVTATTLSKSDPGLVWWASICTAAVVASATVCAGIAVCCIRATARDRDHRRRRNNLKTSISFNDQEKKLLDVSIATTDRGTGSTEAVGGPELELLEPPPVHITIESDPMMPLAALFPPPPAEFSTSALPAGAFGNIFISVSVSRDPMAMASAVTAEAASHCPDLLDLPHSRSSGSANTTTTAVYHGMATLPRRPHCAVVPPYDNMGPRVTAGGSSTLSLPDATAVNGGMVPMIGMTTQIPLLEEHERYGDSSGDQSCATGGRASAVVTATVLSHHHHHNHLAKMSSMAVTSPPGSVISAMSPPLSSPFQLHPEFVSL